MVDWEQNLWSCLCYHPANVIYILWRWSSCISWHISRKWKNLRKFPTPLPPKQKNVLRSNSPSRGNSKHKYPSISFLICLQNRKDSCINVTNKYIFNFLWWWQSECTYLNILNHQFYNNLFHIYFCLYILY